MKNSKYSVINRRVELVKHMHEIVTCANNEEYIHYWLLVVPDEPQEDDFIEIAEDDDEFDHVCELFTRICNSIRKDGGFYIFGDSRAFGCKE